MTFHPLELLKLFVSSNVVQTVHLSAAGAVPADASLHYGIAQQDSNGSLYVVSTATSHTFVAGLRLREDGAVVVKDTTPTVAIGGIGMDDDGRLAAVASGTADTFNYGVPQVSGKVRVSTL